MFGKDKYLYRCLDVVIIFYTFGETKNNRIILIMSEIIDIIINSEPQLFADFFDLSIEESQDFINYLKEKDDTKRKS